MITRRTGRAFFCREKRLVPLAVEASQVVDPVETEQRIAFIVVDEDADRSVVEVELPEPWPRHVEAVRHERLEDRAVGAQGNGFAGVPAHKPVNDGARAAADFVEAFHARERQLFRSGLPQIPQFGLLAGDLRLFAALPRSEGDVVEVVFDGDLQSQLSCRRFERLSGALQWAGVERSRAQRAQCGRDLLSLAQTELVQFKISTWLVL